MNLQIFLTILFSKPGNNSVLLLSRLSERAFLHRFVPFPGGENTNPDGLIVSTGQESLTLDRVAVSCGQESLTLGRVAVS